MKTVVIGGSGLIGTKLVTKLRKHGHEVVAASPNSGVNTLTGEGLAEALPGAQVVVDVANSPSFEAAVLEFFETSTRNLLHGSGRRRGTSRRGVGGGTERLPENGYFRAKLAQEKLIKGSSIPYTIVRATQFFEFIGRIAQEATMGKRSVCHLPSSSPSRQTMSLPLWPKPQSARRSTARSRSRVPNRYLSMNSFDDSSPQNRTHGG